MSSESSYGRIAIGLPSYNGWVSQQTLLATHQHGIPAPNDIRLICGQSSILGLCFNSVYLGALDQEADIFAMLHADVGPGPGWLKKGIDLMREHDLVVLSLVIPITTKEQHTSTAICTSEAPFRYKYLMRDDVLKLPEVIFDTWATKYGTLLINTGCMLINVPRFEQMSRVTTRWEGFNLETWITRGAEGDIAEARPEDWDFSLYLSTNQIPYGAFRYPVMHQGTQWWTLPGVSNSPPQERISE